MDDGGAAAPWRMRIEWLGGDFMHMKGTTEEGSEQLARGSPQAKTNVSSEDNFASFLAGED